MFLKNSSVISSSFNFVISSSKSSGFKPSSTNTLTNFSIDSPNTFSDSKSHASVSGIKSKVESLSHLTLYCIPKPNGTRTIFVTVPVVPMGTFDVSPSM